LRFWQGSFSALVRGGRAINRSLSGGNPAQSGLMPLIRLGLRKGYRFRLAKTQVQFRTVVRPAGLFVLSP